MRAKISPEPGHIGNFQTPKTLRKRLEVTYRFTFDFGQSIASIGHKFFLLKTISSINKTE